MNLSDYIQKMPVVDGMYPVALFQTRDGQNQRYTFIYDYLTEKPTRTEVFPPRTGFSGLLEKYKLLKPRPSVTTDLDVSIRFTFVPDDPKLYEEHHDEWYIDGFRLENFMQGLRDGYIDHHQVSMGRNRSADLWEWSGLEDDLGYGELFDFASTGIVELAAEWRDPVMLERNMLTEVKRLHDRVVAVVATDGDARSYTLQLMQLVGVVRTFRYTEAIPVDGFTNIDKWLPHPIYEELSKTLDGLLYENVKEPSVEFMEFVERICEAGPDISKNLNAVPKVTTVRPETKLNNFVAAIKDRLQHLNK